MERNIKRFLSLVLAFVMVFGMMPANVFATGTELAEGTSADEIVVNEELISEGENVAKIGESGELMTLQAAVNAAQNNDIIYLVADCAESVTITQKKNVAFTIEGNSHVYSGIMTLKGISGDNGQALSIKNVKFECNGNYSIYTDSGSNFRNLTVDTCSFSGASYYALFLRNVYDITIKNTTAVNSGYGFFYASKAVNGLEVDNVEVTGTGYGFNLQYPTNAINFKNMNLDVAGSGLIFACFAKGIITIEGSTIKAGTPVTVQNKGTQRCTLTFIGNNTIICEDENWLINGNEAYFTVNYNGDEDAEDDFTLVLPVTNVAEVNGTGYPTLGEAITVATSGQTITLLADVTEDVTVNKSVTIEGAGKTYTGTITVSGNADSVFQNVNFVKGNIKQTGNNTTASMKVQNCSFANGGYAIEAGRINDLTVVDCTVTGQSLLHVKLHINDVLVKNVTVDSGNYVARYLYGTKARFENVTATNMTGYGIQTQNNGPKTITLANCSFATPNYNSLHVSEVAAAAVDTFIFEGTNTMTVLKDTEYDVYELTEGATLSAPEGYDVVTNVEGFDVIYENGTYKLGVKKNYVAQIGEQGYETLTAAIAAATSGQTITLLADVTEDVTVNKSVTIDGAEKTYTGKMNLTSGSITIKNVNFDGKGYNGYAVETRGASSLTVDNCSAQDYGFGFVQIVKSCKLAAKDVTVKNVNYGFKVDKSAGVTMEGVSVDANKYGIYDSNYGTKTYTIKNSSFSSIEIWERDGYYGVATFKFEGENTVGTLTDSQYAKYVLNEENATLAAPAGSEVTTTVDGLDVIYEGGVYKLGVKKTYVAQIGEQGYETLTAAIAAATSGQTITLLADITEDVTVNKSVTIDGAGKTYTGKMNLTSGTITIKNVNFDGKGYDGYAVETREASSLIIEDCTAKNYGYGFVQIVKNCKLTAKNVTVENVNYGFKVDRSTGVTMENVVVEGAKIYGIYDSNYAAKTYNIKNCSFDAASAPIKIWDRNTGKTTTFLFEGTNSFGATAASLSGLGAMKLAEPEATLAGVEGMDVTTDLKGYEVAYENGIYRLAKHIAQNTNTGAVYTDLSDGLKEAASGQTVILLAETAEELVLVPAGVTFDLNGHVVKEADNVLSFGIVKDSAETVGGIKIDKETTNAFTKLQPENGGYLPIYDTRDGMYKFFGFELVSLATKPSANGNDIKFGVRLAFDNQAGYEVLANTDDSCFDLVLDMQWTGVAGFEIRYVMRAKTVKDYATAAYQQVRTGSDNTKGISATVKGVAGLGSGSFISATPNILSKTEVVGASDTMRYDIP